MYAKEWQAKRTRGSQRVCNLATFNCLQGTLTGAKGSPYPEGFGVGCRQLGVPDCTGSIGSSLGIVFAIPHTPATLTGALQISPVSLFSCGSAAAINVCSLVNKQKGTREGTIS